MRAFRCIPNVLVAMHRMQLASKAGQRQSRAKPMSGRWGRGAPVHGNAAAGLQQLPIEGAENAHVIVAAGRAAHDAVVLVHHLQKLADHQGHCLRHATPLHQKSESSDANVADVVRSVSIITVDVVKRSKRIPTATGWPIGARASHALCSSGLSTPGCASLPLERAAAPASGSAAPL